LYCANTSQLSNRLNTFLDYRKKESVSDKEKWEYKMNAENNEIEKPREVTRKTATTASDDSSDNKVKPDPDGWSSAGSEPDVEVAKPPTKRLKLAPESEDASSDHDTEDDKPAVSSPRNELEKKKIEANAAADDPQDKSPLENDGSDNQKDLAAAKVKQANDDSPSTRSPAAATAPSNVAAEAAETKVTDTAAKVKSGNCAESEEVSQVKLIVQQRRKAEENNDAFMDGWYNWVDDLLEYHKSNGNCQVRDAQNHALYNWLKRQRVMYRKGKLKAEKLKILNLLKANGFEELKPQETSTQTSVKVSSALARDHCPAPKIVKTTKPNVLKRVKRAANHAWGSEAAGTPLDRPGSTGDLTTQSVLGSPQDAITTGAMSLPALLEVPTNLRMNPQDHVVGAGSFLSGLSHHRLGQVNYGTVGAAAADYAAEAMLIEQAHNQRALLLLLHHQQEQHQQEQQAQREHNLLLLHQLIQRQGQQASNTNRRSGRPRDP